MPDFVSENSLNASELEAQLAKAKEANEKHLLEEEPERKSLYEQLKESKEQKHLEYQKLLENQNSSYKLDEKSARFYDELKKNEREKVQQRLKEEEEKLSLYRSLKRIQQKTGSASLPSDPMSSTSEEPIKSSIILRKRKIEINLEEESKVKKSRDLINLNKGMANSTIKTDYYDKSATTAVQTQNSIRHDATTVDKRTLTTANIIQGLGDYSSSDEE